MIKYALKCDNGHAFEAWFQNAAGYDEQVARGFVTCPTCGSASVSKALMAPSVAPSRRAAAAGPAADPPSSDVGSTPMAMLTPEARMRVIEDKLRALRAQVEATSEYVGDTFSDEARRIHDGDAEERAIYGEATREEAQALADDGVPCTPIPWIARRDD